MRPDRKGQVYSSECNRWCDIPAENTLWFPATQLAKLFLKCAIEFSWTINKLPLVFVILLLTQLGLVLLSIDSRNGLFNFRKKMRKVFPDKVFTTIERESTTNNHSSLLSLVFHSLGTCATFSRPEGVWTGLPIGLRRKFPLK